VGKLFIAAAVELSPEGLPRRIRMAPIENFSAASLHPFIAGAVEPGARVIIDGWSGYAGLPGRRHLDEFVFRWNRRRHTAAAFNTLLGIGARLGHASCREFVDQRI